MLVYFVSQRDKYEIVTQPFKNTKLALPSKKLVALHYLWLV